MEAGSVRKMVKGASCLSYPSKTSVAEPSGGMPGCLCFRCLTSQYRSGALSPAGMLAALFKRIKARGTEGIWISVVDEEQAISRARKLEDSLLRMEERERWTGLPLYGLPFAVKDNIDVAGMPTTAGCPEYAYVPEVSATVVRRLEEAGAILVGKTNLDQFAVGLVGVRSPYGPCPNAFNPAYISGGSSSGSAVTVALGLASFSLGTDTAGSGRVPAAFNNIVGLKPTRGVVSTAGVVPACRSLDCVSIFALTCEDAGAVLEVVRGFDPPDIYSRPPSVPAKRARKRADCFRYGIPPRDLLEFHGDRQAAAQFELALRRLERMGGAPVEIDFRPFREAAELLYHGPWVAERLAALKGFFADHPQAVHPVVGAIIQNGAHYSAVETFEKMYRLRELKRTTSAEWEKMDMLVLPTAPTIYAIESVEADPFSTNNNLGYYTNFVNLLDLSAVALPSGIRADGLPFGISMIAPAMSEELLLHAGSLFHGLSGLPMGTYSHPAYGFEEARSAARTGPREGMISIAVVGAHLSGLPLNHQLVELGAVLDRACRTAPLYRLYHLPLTNPPKPGLVRVNGSGVPIEVEVWRMPTEQFGAFVSPIPPPLGIGTVQLEDGAEVKGFICEEYAVKGARDISLLGGWRGYLAGCGAI